MFHEYKKKRLRKGAFFVGFCENCHAKHLLSLLNVSRCKINGVLNWKPETTLLGTAIAKKHLLNVESPLDNIILFLYSIEKVEQKFLLCKNRK